MFSAHSLNEAAGDGLDDFFDFAVKAFARSPAPKLNFPFLELLRADGYSEGNPDQVGVFEFHPRAAIPVVEKDINPLSGQNVVNPVARLFLLLIGVTDRRYDHVEGSDSSRKDNAILVGELLDKRNEKHVEMERVKVDGQCMRFIVLSQNAERNTLPLTRP